MRLTSFLAPVVLASAASAGSFFQQSANQIHEILASPATAGRAVPGESPLYFCADTSRDIAVIERVDLSPNPPLPGEKLDITATGYLKDDITAGAKVDVVVKYGLITLLKQSLDLCDNADQVDLECPVDKGKLNLTKSVDIPAQIPPGVYTVIANAYTADGRPITCLTATVKFYTG